MEKNWFIFENDHHVGPFTAEMIVSMHGQGRINDSTMLWKEGHADWQRYSQCDALDLELLPDLPPLPFIEEDEDDLPPLPEFEDIIEVPKEEVSGVEASQLEEPPSHQELPNIPEDFSKESEELLHEELIEDEEEEDLDFSELSEMEVLEDEDLSEEIEEEVIEEDVETSNELIPTPQGSNATKWALSLISIAAIVGSLYFAANSFRSPKPFRGVSRNDFDQLIAVIKNTNAKKSIIKLALNRNKDELWLASNIKGPAALYITLRSLKDRVFSEEDVVVTAEAILIDHAAHFKELRLVKGDRLVPGEYLVEIKGIPTGQKARINRLLKKFGVDQSFKKVLKGSSTLNYQGKTLLYSDGVDKYQQELQKFITESKKIKAIPIKNRIEFYRTLVQLLNKTFSIYTDVLGSIKTGKSVRKFERNFGTQVSPILQGIVLSSNTKSLELAGKDQRTSEKYEELLNYGKSIGALAADMVVQTKRIRRIGPKSRKRLSTRFQKVVEKLRLEGEGKILSLKKEIEDL